MSFRLPFLILTSALIACTGFLVGSCGGRNTGPAQALEGHEWRVVAISGVASVLPPAKGSATASFEAGRVTGSGTVNRYFATYKLGPGNSLQISDLGATEMAGPPEAMTQETAFFDALIQAVSFEVRDDGLILVDKDGKTLVQFEVIPPASLQGTIWEATALGREATDPDTAVSPLSITAVFAKDGTLSGNASVNQYYATYTIGEGSRMTIDPAIVTTKVGGPPELMAQEAAYLALLPRTARYEIKQNELWLLDEAGEELVHFVAR